MEAAWLLPHSGALPYWVVIVFLQYLEIVVPFIYYLEIIVPMEILPCGEMWVAFLYVMHSHACSVIPNISGYLKFFTCIKVTPQTV